MNPNTINSIETRRPPEAKSYANLLLEFERRKKEAIEAGQEIEPGVELKFLGIESSERVDTITPPFKIGDETVMAAGVEDDEAKKIDAYNGTPPFTIGGKKVTAQRVEPRGGEFDSKVYFFEPKEPDEFIWGKIWGAPVFPMQDPFETTVNIDGEDINIIGGVEVSRDNEKRHTFNKNELQTIGDEIEGLLVNLKAEEINSMEYNCLQADIKVLNKVIQESKGIINLKDSDFTSKYGRARFFNLHSFLSVTWQTVFYKGKSLDTLEKFAVGPKNMKDIRVVDLRRDDGHIGVFGRPQDGKYGRGMISFIELDGLKDLNPDNISKAKVIEGLCIPGEWVGANQLHLLEDGNINVIGHIACFDERKDKCYSAISFIFDPKTHTVVSPVKIIATIDDFPPGEAKRPELKKVFFPSGTDKERKRIWGGLGDARMGVARLHDL